MPSTRIRKKEKKNVNKTRKNHKSLKHFQQQVTIKFLEMLNTIKLYHWKTHSFATHEATDDLYAKLNDHIDTFMEVLLGKHGDRIHLKHVKNIKLKDFNSIDELKSECMSFKTYLVNMDNDKSLQTMSNSDLYSIRDEILADMNKFMYLLTFK
jgi:DNA-binding ferritin-like protein|tara:strand:- start:2099 stop:2557 length:459 start_codon:yes stop_codon:yes gene_type:complete